MGGRSNYGRCTPEWRYGAARIPFRGNLTRAGTRPQGPATVAPTEQRGEAAELLDEFS